MESHRHICQIRDKGFTNWKEKGVNRIVTFTFSLFPLGLTFAAATTRNFNVTDQTELHDDLTWLQTNYTRESQSGINPSAKPNRR